MNVRRLIVMKERHLFSTILLTSLGYLLFVGTLEPGIASASTETLLIMTDTELTENHQGNIVITADGVTLDCDGHRVKGTGQTNGILLSGRTDVTVENCRVTGFNNGIVLENSSNNTFEENKVKNNEANGIVLVDSSGNTFEENQSKKNDNEGIILENSSNNTFEENLFIENGNDGIVLVDSSGNTFEENKVKNNEANGIALENASGNTFEENLLKGNGGDGTDIDEDSVDNRFTENKSKDNEGFGFFDDSSGTGTAETSNTYTENKCKGNAAGGSDPAGLCSQPPECPCWSQEEIEVIGLTYTQNLTSYFLDENPPVITVSLGESGLEGAQGVQISSDVDLEFSACFYLTQTFPDDLIVYRQQVTNLEAAACEADINNQFDFLVTSGIAVNCTSDPPGLCD